MESISEVIGQIWDIMFTCVYVFMIAAFSILGYQVLTFSPYLQQVNYHIERRGGLTEEALSELSDVSKKKYGNWYTIESSQAGEKVSFGETVDYTVKASYPLLIASKKMTFDLPVSAQSISKVR